MQRALRLCASLAGVAFVTWTGHQFLPANATTIGFAYLLLVLIVASVWGFVYAAIASVAATLALNFFFLPPVGRFTISDPQNWVALFSFLATALIAGRLSAQAEQRALDAIARQRDLEQLYTFSRAILLIDDTEPFPKQLVRRLAEIFGFSAVELYERRLDEFFRAGPADCEGLEGHLRDAALEGTAFHNVQNQRVVTAVRLGAEPIAGLALGGRQMPDAVLQGIANLVAIGLERARAQTLAAQMEAVKQSDRLRTTLLDAMAHEFKTPLTSIMAATTSLLSNGDQHGETRAELIRVADEETRHLRDLIDDALEMGRLVGPNIEIQIEPSNVARIVRELIESMQAGLDGRVVIEISEDVPSTIATDRRLVRLAMKQLLDNARKYSPPEQPILVRVHTSGGRLAIAVTDHGEGIPAKEQQRIFDRLYRSPSIERQVPGSGLGLSIARNIARAHGGDLTVSSRPGETTFELTLPADLKEARS